MHHMGRPRLVLARLANHRSTNTHPGSERLASYTVARTLRGNKTDGLGLVDLEAHASFVLLCAANLFVFYFIAFVCPRSACSLFTGHDNGTHPSLLMIAKTRVTRCTIVLETLGYASHVAKNKGRCVYKSQTWASLSSRMLSNSNSPPPPGGMAPLLWDFPFCLPFLW